MSAPQTPLESDFASPIAVTIYHNPACGTSRNTLALIRNAGIEPTVIEYLKTPPDRAKLLELIARMRVRPRAILREKGTPYADLRLRSPLLTDEQLIDAMLAHPILINRPIVVTPWGVKLCRPSEAVLDILPVPQRGPFTTEDGGQVVDEHGQRIRHGNESCPSENNLTGAFLVASDDQSVAVAPTAPAARVQPPTLRDATYLHVFSVPLMTYVWPDSAALNQKLRDRILAHAAQDPGTQATNVGGWHSANGQLEFLGELREPLFQRMLLMVNEATTRLTTEIGRPSIAARWSFLAWANISETGSFNTTHTHPGMTWSGVYYVDTGETPGRNDTGILKFMDPSPGSAASFLPFLARSFPQIIPVAGLMVLFPSYLPHSVLPHRGNRPRISIAFNFRNEPYP